MLEVVAIKLVDQRHDLVAAATASAPPGQKSFCTSMTISASFGHARSPLLRAAGEASPENACRVNALSLRRSQSARRETVALTIARRLISFAYE